MASVLAYIPRIRKALIPVVPAVGVILAAVFGEASEATAIYGSIVALLVSVGIYIVPNKPEPVEEPPHAA